MTEDNKNPLICKFEEDLSKLEQFIEILEQENERLKKENEYIKSKEYAHTELAKMQEELKELQKEYDLGFPITENENERILQWQKEHEAKIHKATTTKQRMYLQGVSGGRYSYHFLPTAIGTSGVVRCSCGAEFEFQEIG